MRRGGILPAVAAVLLGPTSGHTLARAERITIGSKAFPESWILGEALARLARETGDVEVEHRHNLGGTEIVYQALRSGGVDMYPEYTGTIAEVILKSPGRPPLDVMRKALEREGLGISDPLGFQNGYALATTRATAARYGLRKVSDLAGRPELRLGFSHEFLGRQDGWQELSRRYGFASQNVQGIQHELAYQAIAEGEIEVMEIYTTDAQIGRLDLVLLEDDLGFFPRYEAVLLYRRDLPRRAPLAFTAMGRLQGKIDEAHMIRANRRAVLEGRSFQEAAALLLRETLGAEGPEETGRAVVGEITRNTLEHIKLVGLSLLGAILAGVPLGILATRSRLLKATTLAGAGLLQTIPSLALLAFLIPLLGIGEKPALAALFLYGLLPIVRNTHIGLATIPPNLAEAALALGLSPAARLFRVSLPLASPAILAGIKTSAVINIGTATVAALIGAEGLGQPIISGITLRDTSLILEGAVPAAALALFAEWGFSLLDRVLIPRGLRK